MSQYKDFYTPPFIVKKNKLRSRFQHQETHFHLEQQKEFHDLFWNKNQQFIPGASLIKQKKFLTLPKKNKNGERSNSLQHNFKYKQNKNTQISNRLRIRSCVCSLCGHNSTFQQINHDVPLILQQKKSLPTQITTSVNYVLPSLRQILDESQDKKYTDFQEMRTLTPIPIDINNNRRKIFIKQKKVCSIHESMSKVSVLNFQDEKHRHIHRSENFIKSFEPLKKFFQSPSQMQTLPLIKINQTQYDISRKPVSLNVSILRINKKFISPSKSQIMTPLGKKKLFSPGKKASHTQTRNSQLQKFKEYLQ